MIKKSSIIPVNGYCLVESIDPDQNLIDLPEDYKKDQSQYGLVHKVAEEYVTSNGTHMPIYIKPGDRILYGAFQGDRMELEDENGEAKEFRLVEMIFVKCIVK